MGLRTAPNWRANASLSYAFRTNKNIPLGPFGCKMSGGHLLCTDRSGTEKVVQFGLTEGLQKGKTMSFGAINNKYENRQYDYVAQKKTTEAPVQTRQQMMLPENADAPETLGIGFLNVGNGISYGLSASYAQNSTAENPIITVTVTKGKNDVETYEITINEINANNSTGIEMFALCNYADDIGKGTSSTFGSWNTLKNFAFNAQEIGGFCVAENLQDFISVKQDWSKMVEAMTNTYMQAGVYKQAFDGQCLTEIFDLCMSSESRIAETRQIPIESGAAMEDNSPNISEEEYRELLQKQIEEFQEKIENGETEEAFQIGAQTFTIKEWKEFLDKFDSVQEVIEELMRERHKLQEKEKIESERAKKDYEEKTAIAEILFSESTACTYPATDSEKEIRYITWYTEEGIFCRKAGQIEGYEWSITFENKEQYDKVMAFVGQLSEEEDLRFTANKNFWKDFLKGEMDIDSLKEKYVRAEAKNTEIKVSNFKEYETLNYQFVPEPNIETRVFE